MELRTLVLMTCVIIRYVVCQNVMFSAFKRLYRDQIFNFYGNTSTSLSLLECAKYCHKTLHCSSFQFNRNTRRCVAHPVSFEAILGFETNGKLGNDIFVRTNSGALGSSCSSDGDCDVINSTCFNSACACIPGYSFSQSENTCLTQCAVYGDQMMLYPGLKITGHNFRFLTITTVEACIAACNDEPLCLSFDFSAMAQVCLLNDVSYLDALPSERLQNMELFVHGSRNCLP